MDCSTAAVHAPPVSGISGNAEAGAWSVALSGGYPDDVDLGEAFTYTGSGGRDLKGTRDKPKNLRTAPQTFDQSFENNFNAALKTSADTKNPVRVIRGFKLDSPYAPPEGYRYDGLYVVERAWMAPGLTRGLKVCKYAFKRLPGQPPLPRNDEEAEEEVVEETDGDEEAVEDEVVEENEENEEDEEAAGNEEEEGDGSEAEEEEATPPASMRRMPRNRAVDEVPVRKGRSVASSEAAEVSTRSARRSARASAASETAANGVANGSRRTGRASATATPVEAESTPRRSSRVSNGTPRASPAVNGKRARTSAAAAEPSKRPKPRSSLNESAPRRSSRRSLA
jgi:E3 ubiquitin-protein ligase UHRF1